MSFTTQQQQHEPVLFNLLLSDIMSQEELFKRAFQNLDKKIHNTKEEHTSLIASSREVLKRFMKETSLAAAAASSSGAGAGGSEDELRTAKSDTLNTSSSGGVAKDREGPIRRPDKLDPRISLGFDWSHVTQEDERAEAEGKLVAHVTGDEVQCDREKAVQITDEEVGVSSAPKKTKENVSDVAKVVAEWKDVSLTLGQLVEKQSAPQQEVEEQRKEVEKKLAATNEKCASLEKFHTTQPKAEKENAQSLNHVRHERLDVIFDATGRLLLQKMDATHNDITKSCSTLTSEKKEIAASITEDIDCVRQLHDRVLTEKRTAYSSFDAAVSKIQKELQANEDAQLVIWSEVFASVDRLTKLGEDRRLLIQSMVRQKQEYHDDVDTLNVCEKSIGDYECVAGHLKQCLEDEVKMLDKLQHSSETSVKEADKRVVAFERDHDYANLVLEERLQYSKAFQRYFNIASKLIVDQQATVRELQSQLLSSKHMLRKQQENNATSDQMASLETHVGHINQIMAAEMGRLETLQDESSGEIGLYKPTEEALNQEAASDGLLDDQSKISALLKRLENQNFDVLEEEVKEKKEAVSKKELEIREGRAGDPDATAELSPLRRRRQAAKQQELP